MITVLALLAMGISSCQKCKYCQCYAYVDGEDIGLGEDISIEELTADQIDAMQDRYRYNLYVIEHGSCKDKAKEIVGWDQGSARVTCEEVKCKADEESWFQKLFKKKNTNNNNNNNNIH